LRLFVRRDWARSLTEGDRGLEVPDFSGASRTSRPSIWRRVRSWKVQTNPPAWHDSHWRVSGIGSHFTLRKRLERNDGQGVGGVEEHQGEKDGPFVTGSEGTGPLALRGCFLRALNNKGVLARRRAGSAHRGKGEKGSGDGVGAGAGAAGAED
jgi:hypothetical protein